MRISDWSSDVCSSDLPRTDSIALYLEETNSSRRFTSALRAAASVKPVVVLKAGRKNDDSPAQDFVFDALLRRAGAVRIRYFVQLVSALTVLVHTRRSEERRVGKDGASKVRYRGWPDT